MDDCTLFWTRFQTHATLGASKLGWDFIMDKRKRDTRRKIIMGGLAGFHMEKNPRSAFAKKLAALIDDYVIGDKERALFDLEPLPKDEVEIRRIKHKNERKT